MCAPPSGSSRWVRIALGLAGLLIQITLFVYWVQWGFVG
jgi:hypothetical protein